MAKKAKRQRATVGADVTAALGISTPVTYQERKAAADKERIRLRVDIPAWLKELADQEAASRKMSTSQLCAFLLAYGLLRVRDPDGELVGLIERNLTRIASLRWTHGLDLGDFEDALTQDDGAE